MKLSKLDRDRLEAFQRFREHPPTILSGFRCMKWFILLSLILATAGFFFRNRRRLEDSSSATKAARNDLQQEPVTGLPFKRLEQQVIPLKTARRDQ